MGDIEDLKQAIQRDFITPLSEFRTQVQPLDGIHDQRVQAFEHEIWALFGPDSSFSGNAADALAELVGNYLTAEQALGDYTSTSLSDLLAKAAASCDSTVTSMEPILASLQAQGFPGVTAAGAVLTQTKNVAQEDGGPPGPENPLWDFIVVSGIVIAGGAFLWEQGQQQIKIRELWQDIQQWQASMRNLAQQTESALPPDASEAQIFMPIASSLHLTTQQQKTAQELFHEFGGDISLDAIENLIRQHPQWTKERIRQELLRTLLKSGKGYPGQLVGKTIQLSGGNTKTLTSDDVEAMIKSGYTYTHFAVILGLLALADATTPEGRKLSWHALTDSIPRHGITLQAIDEAIDDYSRVRPCTDGSKAYIKTTKQGITLVIQSQDGQIVTAMKDLKQSDVRSFGRKYGFDPNP